MKLAPDKLMSITPTNGTAATAGVWSATGIVPFEAWMDHVAFSSVLMHNLAWLAAYAAFLLVPVIFLVIGRQTRLSNRAWMLDPTERAEHWIITKRMFAWFVSAAATGTLVSGVCALFKV